MHYMPVMDGHEVTRMIKAKIAVILRITAVLAD